MRRLARHLLLALVLLLALAAALGAWLAGSESGQHGLLARVPGLLVVAPQGRIGGGAFAAQRIEVTTRSLRVIVEQPSWRELRWRWRPFHGAWLGIELEGARAQRVHLLPVASDAPLRAPASLRVPVALRAPALEVAALQWADQSPLTALRADLELGRDGGREHRIEALSLATGRASLQGQAHIAADAPFALRADAALQSGADSAQAWQARVEARGELARFALHARLTRVEAAGAALELDAALTPFTPWPIASLAASLRELDLADLVAGAPHTKLSGRADIDSRGLDQPLAATITLTNAAPGRWDRQRLPVAALELALAGHTAQRQRIAVQRFEIALADQAGRVSGAGAWNDGQAALDLTLAGVRPAALDARAPAMTLAGRAQVQLDGLPAPDGSRPAATEQGLEAQFDLQGAVRSGGSEPVRLTGRLLAARAGAAARVELNGFDARSGAARATGQVRAERRGSHWQIATRGDLAGFDPTLWWPGLRERVPTPVLLSGRWQADLALPAAATPSAANMRGSATLELADSRIAGVPVRGNAHIERVAAGWSIRADALAAGNRIAAQGLHASNAADERWSGEVEAPALDGLRPLLRDAAPAGRVSARFETQGRWPALKSSGTLSAAGLAWQRQRATQLDARWQLGADADAPLTLTLDGQGLTLGPTTLERVRANVEGTRAAHRLALEATSALRPPAWTDALLGNADSRASRIALRADGQWQPAARGEALAGRWLARNAELDAQGVPGDGRAAPAPWLVARELQAELDFAADGTPLAARALPGRATLFGAAVRWREAQWQAALAGQPTRTLIDAELEPLPIAPWLTRRQPNAGFGGDLVVQGRARIAHGARFEADVVLERARGDLAVSDEGGSTALGLTDLRLAYAAQDGTWHFTQAAAGANLGVLAGAQSLRIAPEATWPAADAPMQGVLEWRVPDLNVWTRFMPPGWRVGGTLRTSAAIGGRFGAPEVEGELTGEALALRNLLQGVDLREGRLALSLRGARATIERFEFKGGEGTLRLTGGATLGTAPGAQLRLTAERFRLLGRIDRRIVASGQAELALGRRSAALEGRFRIDEGLIDISRADAPALDSDVTVVRGAAPAAEAAPRRERRDDAAPPRDVKLALQVDLGDALRLRGRGLDTRLAGQLAFAVPQGQLALNGTVRTESGTYAAYGQKLEIERGLIVFTGAAENPRLDILALRPNLDLRVGVQVSGTAQAPRVRLISEPEMAEMDKLSWLVLGRAPDGLARNDTALLQRAAMALLAGEDEGPQAALLGNLGLDDLSLRQTESGEVRETVVTLGKQLSRRWYVGYERSVNATTGTWQLVYRVAQRFTVRAQSGQENALDAIWTWRWN